MANNPTTNAFSGKLGTVKHAANSGTPTSSLLEVTDWKLERSAQNPAACTNATAGWKSRNTGVKDSKGSVDVKVPSSGGIPYHAGDLVSLALHVDASGNNYVLVPAIIESDPLECNIDGGDFVSYTYQFAGCGPAVFYGILAPTGSGSGT